MKKASKRLDKAKSANRAHSSKIDDSSQQQEKPAFEEVWHHKIFNEINRFSGYPAKRTSIGASQWQRSEAENYKSPNFSSSKDMWLHRIFPDIDPSSGTPIKGFSPNVTHTQPNETESIIHVHNKVFPEIDKTPVSKVASETVQQETKSSSTKKRRRKTNSLTPKNSHTTHGFDMYLKKKKIPYELPTSSNLTFPKMEQAMSNPKKKENLRKTKKN